MKKKFITTEMIFWIVMSGIFIAFMQNKVIAIAIIFIIVITIWAIRQTKIEKDKIYSKIKNKKDFDASKTFITPSLKNAIAIDNYRNKLCLVENSAKVYEAKDVLEVEILEDGLSSTKTSRGSQLGGILLGGLAFGGVGAIIGGLSSKKIQIDKICNLDLKIIVNDSHSPVFTINIFNHSEGVKKNGFIYKNAIEEARMWNGLITVLIKKADEEDKKNITKPNNIKIKPENSSLSQELLNINKLRKDGLLNDKEYKMAKIKILSSS